MSFAGVPYTFIKSRVSHLGTNNVIIMPIERTDSVLRRMHRIDAWPC